MESDLLYGDIDDNSKQIKIDELQHLYDNEKNNNKILLTEINQLKQQMNELINERKQIEINMLTLYNTSKREIKRKDDIIISMNRKLSSSSSKKEVAVKACTDNNNK
jgi:hypothetical protein